MSETPPVCQQCGAPVTAGSLFCSRCGVDVTAPHGVDAATLEMTAVGAPAPRVKSTMRQTLRDATLGEYEIMSELGRGGMATVFLAHDISLDRKVAIKVMAAHLLEGEGMAERFKLEARTAAQLSHPHIIPIYAVRETEEALFFVMKYVEGRTLDEIIKKMGQMPIPMVKDILTKVGSGLGYAHRRNVIHRDVKPGNIMIDEEGTPIVTDFGIAKVAETKGLTMTGTTIGTPAYMSPEQCEAKEVTGASDQYSLGIVAWEMLTGRTPFAGDSAVTTMYKHCHEPLPPLEDFRPDCPPEILEAVTRMLAKSPGDRWPSLEAAIRKLSSATDPSLDPVRQQLLDLARDTGARELIAQLSTPRSPMPSIRTAAAPAPGTVVAAPAPARRNWFPVLALAGVLVAAAGGALAVLQPWGQAPAVGGVGTASEPIAPPTGSVDVPTQAPNGGAPPPATGAAGGGAPSPGADGPPAAGTRTTPPAASPSGATAAPPARPAAQPNTPSQPRASVVATVRVGGARGGLEPGDRLILSATALDAAGGALTGSTVQWTSSDPGVGSVAPDGTFTAVGPGSVVVTATVAGVAGRETITVGAVSVASISVEPGTLSLTQGERSRLAAQARTRDGASLGAGGITWTSDAPSVATVGASGEVEAVGPGSATITARSGNVSAGVRVTVAPPAVDARTAVEGLITAYARALESRDINQVRRAYPGMTPDQERQLSAALPNIQRADLRIESFSEQGDQATARVGGTYTFINDGRPQQIAVPTFTATFQRDGSGWRMTRTQ